MIMTALIVAAICYLCGSLIRGLTAVGICIAAVILFDHFTILELIIAGVVVWLLASKGLLTGGWNAFLSWWNVDQQPPTA